jgi:hypothetical protein
MDEGAGSSLSRYKRRRRSARVRLKRLRGALWVLVGVVEMMSGAGLDPYRDRPLQLSGRFKGGV